MKIYLTRHGETEWNKLGKMQGWKNSNLTEKGIEHAKKLGQSLKDVDFDCIYCSPLGRAIETAECIKGDRDISIIIKESLKEMGFGSWEGMEHSKVEELYSVEKYNFWNKPHLYEPIHGESYQDLINRAREALDEIIKNSKCENILVVSHAAFIKALYLTIKEDCLENFWNPPFLHGTCLTVLEVIDNKINIILEADMSHLDN